MSDIVERLRPISEDRDVDYDEIVLVAKIAMSEIIRLRAELATANTALEAWHSVFGTSQLSHAQARLEAAEHKAMKNASHD